MATAGICGGRIVLQFTEKRAHQEENNKTRDLARADIFDYIEVFYNGPGATVTSAASVRRPSNRPRVRTEFVYGRGVSPINGSEVLDYPWRFNYSKVFDRYTLLSSLLIVY